MTDEIDIAFVVARLEEAGATLMALPSNAPRLGQKVQTYGYVVEQLATDAKADPDHVARLPVPGAAEIDRMDATYSWLGFIGNRTTRRIVAARSLTRAHTGKPAYSWLKLAKIVGGDVRAIKGWHEKGLAEIAMALGKSRVVGKWEGMAS